MEDLTFFFLERFRIETLCIRHGLLTDIVLWDEVEVRLCDLNKITKGIIKFNLKVFYPSSHLLFPFTFRDPNPVIVSQ